MLVFGDGEDGGGEVMIVTMVLLQSSVAASHGRYCGEKK